MRELENDVRRAVLTCHDGEVLEPSRFGPVRWIVEPQEVRPAAFAPGGHMENEPPTSSPPVAVALPSASAVPAASFERLPSSARIRAVRLLHEVRDEAEKRAIAQALERTRWNKSLAARLLGISRNGLAARMRELNFPVRAD